MNDEQMQSLLDTWYREREIPRPKVQTGVASGETRLFHLQPDQSGNHQSARAE